MTKSLSPTWIGNLLENLQQTPPGLIAHRSLLLLNPIPSLQASGHPEVSSRSLQTFQKVNLASRTHFCPFFQPISPQN